MHHLGVVVNMNYGHGFAVYMVNLTVYKVNFVAYMVNLVVYMESLDGNME